MFYFYYFDYLYIFMLLFVFVSSFFKNIIYIYPIRATFLNIFISIFKIIFLYEIFTILSLNTYFIQNSFKFNFFITFKLIFSFFCIIFLVFLKNYSKVLFLNNFEYFFTFIFSLFSLSLFLQSNNFLYFYVVLESYTLSICSVFAIKKLNKKLIESSFRYFIFSIISSCLILFGISNLYLSSGSINLSDINQMFSFFNFFIFQNVYNYAYLLIIVGFFMKLSIFPFSLFLVEIYSSLPSIYIFFLLILPKFVFILFLFNNVLFYLNSTFLFLIIFLVSLTSFIHSLTSIYTSNLKNIIVNTSFANAPFMILPIFYKSIFLLNSFFNFILVYFFNLFCFFVVLFLSTNKDFFIKKITNFISFFNTNTSLTFLFTVNLLSLSSLPPFSGFFVKLYFFFFFIEFKLYFLYFFLSFINLLIIYSYLKIIRLFFIKKQNLFLKNLLLEKNILLFFLSFLTFFSVIFLLFFDIFYSIFFIFFNFNILF